jgi:two-component system alkaline phosphatase synthesis response regulator PhoP
MKKRIQLVEDEPNLAKGLKLNFELEGHEVRWAATGAEARKQLAEAPADLVILDLMLPDVSGFDLLQEIKRKDIRQPVLVLTARAGDDDRIAGLSLGADDYVTKPFHLDELVLRVRGMLRRGEWYRAQPAEEIRFAGVTISPVRSTLARKGATYLLTERELALAQHLWRRRGQCVPREELLVEVWGYTPDTQTRTVDIFVSRLRKMLGDDAESPRLLLTVRGQGYMLAGEP